VLRISCFEFFILVNSVSSAAVGDGFDALDWYALVFSLVHIEDEDELFSSRVVAEPLTLLIYPYADAGLDGFFLAVQSLDKCYCEDPSPRSGEPSTDISPAQPMRKIQICELAEQLRGLVVIGLCSEDLRCEYAQTEAASSVLDLSFPFSVFAGFADAFIY